MVVAIRAKKFYLLVDASKMLSKSPAANVG
jgi:hypothetical protein